MLSLLLFCFSFINLTPEGLLWIYYVNCNKWYELFMSVIYNFKTVLLLSSNLTLSSVTTWTWLIHNAVSQYWYHWLRALIKCKMECLKRHRPCWLRWQFHSVVPCYWNGQSKALSGVQVLVWKKQFQFKYFLKEFKGCGWARQREILTTFPMLPVITIFFFLIWGMTY